MAALDDAVSTDIVELAEHDARRKLAVLAADGERQRVGVQTLLTRGVAAHEILKASEETAADLIVLATTHKSALDRTLVGSTAEQVVRQATVPVLSIPIELAVTRHEIGKAG
jgi:nucleotide-binding universal stress UspA family protein